jgi:hypothetical protein
MRGDLSETSAADACRDLARGAATGALALQGPDGPGRILFVDGRLIAAVSPTPRARLGDRLVGAGLLEDDALTTALRLQADDPGSTRLGALLVGRGLVSHDAVRLFVQEQLLDAMFEIIGWRYGTFEFVEGRGAEIPEVPLELSVDDALVEVSRRQQEWDELSQLIPDLEAVPAFSAASSSASAALEPDEFAVLASVDGERSIRELAADLGYGEFEAARIVYGLTLLGVLEVQLPEDEIGAALDEAFAFFSEPDDAEERTPEEPEERGSADVPPDEQVGEVERAPTDEQVGEVEVWVSAPDEPDEPDEQLDEDEVLTDATEVPVEAEASVPSEPPVDEETWSDLETPGPRLELDDDLGAILTALRDEPAPAGGAATPPRSDADDHPGDHPGAGTTDDEDELATWFVAPPEEPAAAEGDEAPAPTSDHAEVRATPPAGPASAADVSELLRELSRLAIDEPPAKDEPRRGATDDDPRPRPAAPPPDEAKRKKRGLFGWGG